VILTVAVDVLFPRGVPPGLGGVEDGGVGGGEALLERGDEACAPGYCRGPGEEDGPRGVAGLLVCVVGRDDLDVGCLGWGHSVEKILMEE
jgi:hypothetical protein